MGVGEQFIQFRNNYLIPQETVTSISSRYRQITKRLNLDFWDTDSETSHSLYIGSYGRDTAARGVSDLDIYFRLPYAVYEKYHAYQSNGQSALLQAVRSSMQKTYHSTSLKGDGQVVVVTFTDGITFEVLPAFVNKDESVTFADSNGGGTWRSCNPKAEMDAFAKRNGETNNNLKALCRMMRIWKAVNNVPISGMLIDTLAYNFIDSWPHKEKSYLYHDYLVRDFTKYLSEYEKTQDRWNAPGSGSWVRRTGNFESKAAIAYDKSLTAISHETNNRQWSAAQTWREIFGNTFPEA